eukprot:CAMPEP_0117012566 /NCGR_PEP_ID=MMETSP0472-20121206/10548_1 /TAXON_ID=693140 ORGANISM="Tiarina fusus, Strain LIS" /NCGR_SAMPLE_ID=MMETSP0472 /ASSEMBLY_ACC=CAM_ASM_000603 /LENGTH=1529 /DNA_ID=CAMNT_0004715667 /DNA_START=109 /DNA_END=4698 /DNA_ORIENTATION=+
MIFSAIASAAFLAASVGAQDIGTPLTYTGYLADMLCARLEIAPDGANMILNPEEHTVRCELLPACLRSGYGIVQGIGSQSTVLRQSWTNPPTTLSWIFSTPWIRRLTLGTAPAAETPAISSRDGERNWPAMNNIPLLTVDALEFCNYEGPDANFPKQPGVCSSESILNLLASETGRNTLAGANLCMREEISLTSDQDSIVVGHSGCADHATFQDVKRADAQSCSQTANPECDNVCEETDTCAAECTDACGNPLVLASGVVAKACCLDACGNPIVDPCGIPFLDACGNPTLADGTACPAANVAENQANDCLDVCGNPVVDACGNPVEQCCLDPCGNPLLDPCGFPWLDPCGNPAMNANGDLCANFGANVCLPSEDTCDHSCGEDTCTTECVDACGNPIVLASGVVAKSCCLDACGNPLVDGCGFPFYDACGNPTAGYSGAACPAEQIAVNEVNDCLDVCGNPVVDACGNPVDACCLDACGNPILDPCGFPWLDPCGNPAMDVAGALCSNLGENVCLPSTDCSADGPQCALECVDACGNPLPIDISGRPASSCCLDACGNPILDPCGFPFYDPCGNPTTSDGSICTNIAENEINECVDACGNPITDTCGSPVENCCVDPCGNPVVDACGFAVLDPCGNPLTGLGGDLCPAGQLGDNDCVGGADAPAWRKLSQERGTQKKRSARSKGIRKTMIANHNKIQQAKRLLESGPGGRRLDGHEGCHADCVDACGNPLPVDISGRPAKTCCLDPCGNPLLDACGFPFYDACGNPTSGYSGAACPPEQIGESDYNECLDVCGSPVVDACGNPVAECCLDACGNPLLDPCGYPWLDPCGNPAVDASGATCAAQSIGGNACLEESDGGTGCAAGCLDSCGNPLPVDISGRPAKTCCLDPCGNPLLDACGFPFYDACGNPTSGYSGEACPSEQVATNDINECIDGCGSPVVDACGNPVTQCCLDACGNPLLDPCGFPWLDACGNPVMDASGGVCANLGENVCLGGDDDGDDTCSPASVFPPATESFQCEGLVSACTVAAAGSTDFSEGIPDGVGIGRRRMAAIRAKRRMQSVPSVPLYTPVKKDLRFKIPNNPTTMRSRKELDPAHEGIVGVAVNGVPIVYEHPGEGANTLLFDSCGGHGDLANRYHYHIPPVCLLRSLGGTVPRVSDWWLAPSAETQWPSKASERGEKSPLVGWAIDGNPIFGPYNPDNGELVVPAGAGGPEECSANTLDECNGMTLENGIYAYFITPTFPFVPPCLMGEVPVDAVVDGGLMDGEVSMCPFEGTDPLAGAEICDEKVIVFTDETCPGNADRLAIRNCFELAAASFVGEPTCSQMENAIAESSECFLSAGCCHDLQQTIAEWVVRYPSLEECTLLEPECQEFGSDNVVDFIVQLDLGVEDLVPDTMALLRATMASELGVEASQVSIDRVTGNSDASTLFFAVAYPTEEDAAAAAESFDAAAVAASVSGATGLAVSSLEAQYSVPPPVRAAPELWSTRNKAGLGSSLAAIVVLLGILVFLEDKPHGEAPATEGPKDGKMGNV